MTLVTIYSRTGCHLCEDALKVLESLKQELSFEIKEVLQDDTQASLFWQMQYRHPKLNKGEIVRVDGMSQLKFHQRIYFHRDYFDLGQMLYEHLPCMGGLIRLLKDRAAK